MNVPLGACFTYVFMTLVHTVSDCQHFVTGKIVNANNTPNVSLTALHSKPGLCLPVMIRAAHCLTHDEAAAYDT